VGLVVADQEDVEGDVVVVEAKLVGNQIVEVYLSRRLYNDFIVTVAKLLC